MTYCTDQENPMCANDIFYLQLFTFWVQNIFQPVQNIIPFKTLHILNFEWSQVFLRKSYMYDYDYVGFLMSCVTPLVKLVTKIGYVLRH